MHDPLQHCRSHCLSDISQRFSTVLHCMLRGWFDMGRTVLPSPAQRSCPRVCLTPLESEPQSLRAVAGRSLANLAIGCDLQFATAQVHCWRVTASVGTCAYHGISLTLRPVQACSHVVFCCKGSSWSTYDANPRSLGIARLKCHHFGPHHHLQLPFALCTFIV